ncbi:hypothetical protein CTAYLR_008147 [Chrysophaeum taylorii]|uniref:Alpha-soluble NSF attachment protein n=1 Tax=Chrysophaeum taylorii TaxID=2483200 RepID=A0AAD7UJ82_9STRA|nr:hypothetical protein CTAYLR_008147 [Chrysophaeum taylorii]
MAAALGGSLKKAQELEAKGEKALTKFSFFASGSKFEEAAELMNDAGKMYVMAKSYRDGGRTYERAAELHLKTKAEFDAGSSYTKAAEAWHKAEDMEKCAEAYEQAVAVYAGIGKCSMAANNAKKLGDILEGQGDLRRAIEAFQQAIDLYETEGRPQSASQCRERAAFLSADVGDLKEAQQAFEEMGRASLQSNLGKFNAKKWFTNAVLCALARTDTVAASNKLVEFKAIDYTLEGTREAQLCEALVAACESNDDAAVATAAADYDKIKRLDPWMTKLLLTIKSSVSPLDDDEATAAAPDGPPDADDAEDLPDLT